MVLLPALALSACGGGGSPKAGSSSSASPSRSVPVTPTPSVQVPSGVTLTRPGSRLQLGQAATVPYRPNDKRSSVLRMRVTSIDQGTLKQLNAYVLDRSTRQSTPYYVHLTVANVGNGNVGSTDVPLWAVGPGNTLVHSSSFTNTFKRCPSRSLPKSFGPGKHTTACLVFLLPSHGKVSSVSFRPVQAVAPIEWHGTVKPPPGTKKMPAHKKGAHQKGSKKH